jgi:hypothetical protein
MAFPSAGTARQRAQELDVGLALLFEMVEGILGIGIAARKPVGRRLPMSVVVREFARQARRIAGVSFSRSRACDSSGPPNKKVS